LNHFTVPRAIVDLPTDDPADIILIGGLAANDFGAPAVGPRPKSSRNCGPRSS
jgi:hypothetical protein